MTANDAPLNPITRAIQKLFNFYDREMEPDDALPYVKALRRFPSVVALAAIARAKETRAFLPKPVELVEDAETCAGESPRSPHCEDCRSRGGFGVPAGWTEIVDEKGVKRLKRCDRCAAGQTQHRVPSTATDDRPAGEFTDAHTMASSARDRLTVVGGRQGRSR